MIKKSLCVIILGLSGCISNINVGEDVNMRNRGFLERVFNPVPKISYYDAISDRVLTYEERNNLSLNDTLTQESKQQYLEAIKWVALWLQVSEEDVEKSLCWRLVNSSVEKVYEPFFGEDVGAGEVVMLSGSNVTYNGKRIELRTERLPDN